MTVSYHMASTAIITRSGRGIVFRCILYFSDPVCLKETNVTVILFLRMKKTFSGNIHATSACLKEPKQLI